jgi:adenylate cyclase
VHSYSIIDELVRTTNVLSQDMNKKSVSRSLVEQALDITRADLAALYVVNPDDEEVLPLLHKRGRFPVPAELEMERETVDFILDCREALVVNVKNPDYFGDIFLHPDMASGIAVPLLNQKVLLGVLILNAKEENHFGASRLSFIDSFSRMVSGLLRNIDLFQEVKQQLREIEGLQRYQASIFNSMTNLLVTVDGMGRLRYFNPTAAERFALTESDIGRPADELFLTGLGKKAANHIRKVEQTGKIIMGLEGIYQGSGREMDYSLNIAPLKGARGKNEGLTLLFSDQTRERELKSQMESAVEDRRIVKDMFSRYLSSDIVSQLMDNPEFASLGGAKKEATIFFADICGYTSFSEGKEPEYIVEVLNEFFSVALEVVIKYQGYIDKLIGDCIMAAFGVPMPNGIDDAINAVACAVEIQALVNDKKRTFFRGAAEHLKVSIGMNTGPVVVGNLGSNRRMDYSVISDTVNTAARLEGVATADDIIISASTRDAVGDRFKIKELPPVKVKGKEKPVPIFNVLGIKH